MKQTGRRATLSKLLIVALLLGLSMAGFFHKQHSIEVNAQSVDAADGVYTIEGRLWHAAMDQPSMGNAAITQPMKIVKNGNSILLQLEFHSLNAGALTGYLYGFYYFPTWSSEEEAPNGEAAVSVTVTEYYAGVYDDYNHPSTGLDATVKGKAYPHFAVMPIAWNAASTWVQVYVPVMEAVSAGSGMQYARLLLDWDTLNKTEEKAEDIATTPAQEPSGSTVTPGAAPGNAAAPDTESNTALSSQQSDSGTANTGSTKLKIGSLKDGTYTITGEMVKTDKKNLSMSNEAINHNIILTVKKGKYTLTMRMSGLTVGSSKGYLSKLKYFKNSYKTDKNGVPSGTTAAVTIDTYQKDSSGKKISDSYGTNYPKKITFPLIEKAKKDGYVPLQVFVPIMEEISAGTGTQPVYLKLDLSSITAGAKKTEDNSEESTDEVSADGAESNPETTVSDSDTATGTVTGTTDTVKGKVYSCQIVPCYKHPITGIVEDSGGESSYATGQGMVESVLGTSGMLEETESGAYYLTMRISLMDMTSGHKFWTQKRGESVWNPVSAAITQTGSDKNGKNSDFCIPVPDKDSIVKLSMYVEPMGRNVIFYAYSKNLNEGQPSDMKATKVSSADTAVGIAAGGTDGNGPELQDTILPAEDTEEISSLSGVGLSNAQGLSLSTAGEAALDEDGSESSADGSINMEVAKGQGMMSVGRWIIALTVSFTVSGLLLMAVGAWLVYFFRRNWRRWGEEMEDDKD